MRRNPLAKLRSQSRSRVGDDVHEDDRDAIYELVEAAKSGDRLAMGDLFDAFHSIVYRTVTARVGSREDTEDIVAETFLEAWRSIPKHRWMGAPFAAWLLTIAVTRCNMHYRRASSRPVAAGAAASEAALQLVADGADEYDRSAQRNEALTLLATLPEEQRTVLALRFYGGLSAEEIAEVLGKRPGSVRQMQMVALKRLGQTCRVERAA